MSVIPRFCLIQLAAIAVAYLLFELVSLREAIVLVWCIGFSHYLLGIIYSRQQLATTIENRAAWIPLVLLGLGGLGLFWSKFSLFLFFGLHHALNEAYVGLRYRAATIRDITRKRLQLFGFVAHLLGYMIIVYNTLLAGHPYWLAVLSLVFISSIAGYFYQLILSKKEFDRNSFITALIPELLLLLLIALDLTVYPINAYQIVLYHFVFWVIFPATNFRLQQQTRGYWIYLVLTALSVAVFVIFSPIFSDAPFGRYIEYKYWFIALSYFHITVSFAISAANPEWVRRFFIPRLQKLA